MIKSLLGDDEPERQDDDIKPAATPRSHGVFLNLHDDGPVAAPERSERPEESLSAAESIRRSGMAWSAGIAFFAAVVFMLILGWGADVLLGSSPWGIVGGIILGSIIGFVQFFRITSQIFKR